MHPAFFRNKALSVGLLALLAGGTLLLSSCIKNEKDMETACLPPQIIQSPLLSRYFDNYKPGSYWIYSTADGLQKDSFYVTQRSPGIFIDKDCNVEDSTLITAYSSVLDLAGSGAVFKIGGGGRITAGTVRTLVATTATGRQVLSLEAFDEEAAFRYYCKECGLPPADAQPLQKLAYQHPALLGGRVLDTVWQQFGTVIAPNLGMVQFVKPQTTDTFYLQRTRF